MMSEVTASGGTNTHTQIAAEVLELGQALFDDLITFVETHPEPDAADEPFSVEASRAAADEFFRALRLLLRVNV